MAERSKTSNPPQRLLMGPGPINADPRVLQAMSAPLLGQFDPAVPPVHEGGVRALPRRVPDRRTAGRCSSTAPRAPAIEAALVSLIEPGDRVLVPVFGRFGHLKVEIAQRCGAEVRAIETEWGTVFPPKRSRRRSRSSSPKLVAVSHGDTSTTMAQPLSGLGKLCRRTRRDPLRRRHRHARRHGPAGRRLAARRGERRPAEVPRRPVGQRAAHVERAGREAHRSQKTYRAGIASRRTKSRATARSSARTTSTSR